MQTLKTTIALSTFFLATLLSFSTFAQSRYGTSGYVTQEGTRTGCPFSTYVLEVPGTYIIPECVQFIDQCETLMIESACAEDITIIDLACLADNTGRPCTFPLSMNQNVIFEIREPAHSDEVIHEEFSWSTNLGSGKFALETVHNRVDIGEPIACTNSTLPNPLSSAANFALLGMAIGFARIVTRKRKK